MELNPQVRSVLEEREKAAASQPAPDGLEAAREAYTALRRSEDVQGEPIGKVEDVTVPGPAGDLAARLYTPVAESGAALPGMVFFHGGGFVHGSLDSHGGLCRLLANGAGCRVLSVAYRLAPEHPFPAAVHDAYAAACWVESSASDVGIDPNSLSVAGDSAGGTLAAAVTLLAKDKGAPELCHQLLIYPVTHIRNALPSMTAPPGPGLHAPEEIEALWEKYLADPAQAQDKRASPLLAEDLSGLPPAYVVTAEHDRFRDEGRAYAKRLREAGVDVTHQHYDDMIHGFFSMGGRVDAARSAVVKAAEAVGAAFQSR